MPIKNSLVGAGSFVFGPSFLSQLFLEHRLEGVALRLVDVDLETAEAMANVGRAMARESGIAPDITATTDLSEALDGADFVLCSAAIQMHRRFAMDCNIIDRVIPGHIVTEFGGIAGMSSSLRQIALIEAICDDMRQLCPDAMLMTTSNPLPRVAQAAHERRIRTVGFCSATLGGYSRIWEILGHERTRFPFEKPVHRLEATMAGVNHFCWLLELLDRETGADLLPELFDRMRDGAHAGSPLCARMALETDSTCYRTTSTSMIFCRRSFIRHRSGTSRCMVPAASGRRACNARGGCGATETLRRPAGASCLGTTGRCDRRAAVRASLRGARARSDQRGADTRVAPQRLCGNRRSH